MKIFITGGTGFIGRILTRKLVANGHEVRLLVRDIEKVKRIFPDSLRIIPGDIHDTAALLKGMQGCDQVFHLAAYARPWSKDPSLPFKVNVAGTVNVLETALKSNISRVVFTSTAGTMGYSVNGTPATEETNRNPEYFTEYDRTKALAEGKAIDYYNLGLPVVIVNPSRVYGPGYLGISNSVTRIIKLYMKGRWRIIPGNGNGIGNYVFIEDVVNGHILASEKGRPGQRYILGGENLSFNDMFRLLGNASGNRRRMIYLPAGLLSGIATGMKFLSNHTGLPAIITKGWVRKYLNNGSLSSSKAIEELDYKITSFDEGLKHTISWLKSSLQTET